MEYESVWDAHRSPSEASFMKVKSAVMGHLRDNIGELACSPKDFDNIYDGRLSQFSLKKLMKIADASGITINLSIEKIEK